MSTDLTGWERPYLAKADQTPFVFLVAFGADPHAQPLSRSVYRCSGVPGGLDLQGYAAHSHPGYLEGLRSGYLWDTFVAENPRLADVVAACTTCTVLAGDVEDASSLNYLRDIVGIGQWLFACGAAVIYDPQNFTWWTRERWDTELFQAGQAEPHKHVQILHSDDPEPPGHWLHTRGLRLFGRPDISLRNVPDPAFDVAVTLVNRLIAFQALGGVITGGVELSLTGLPAGLVADHRGDLDDPDFNNVHVEIRWTPSN